MADLLSDSRITEHHHRHQFGNLELNLVVAISRAGHPVIIPMDESKLYIHLRDIRNKAN